LLEIQIYLPNSTLSYNYFIGRVLPTTYEALARYAASLEQRVKELTALVDQLRRQVADLQARVANLTALLAAARTDNERLSAVLAQVRAERDALRAQLDQVQAQLSAVSQAKAAVEAQLADARRQLCGGFWCFWQRCSPPLGCWQITSPRRRWRSWS
jgi:chaperonin cofactor prefoldin